MNSQREKSPPLNTAPDSPFWQDVRELILSAVESLEASKMSPTLRSSLRKVYRQILLVKDVSHPRLNVRPFFKNIFRNNLHFRSILATKSSLADDLYKELLRTAVEERIQSVQKEIDFIRESQKRATDNLTGLNTRESLCKLITYKLQDSKLVGKSGAVIMLDIDHFKQFNDRHGHATGDSALKVFANLLVNHFRRNDIIARYGGEKFTVFLSEVEADSNKKNLLKLRQILKRVRRSTVKHSPIGEQNENLHIIFSAGVRFFNYSDDNIRSTEERIQEYIEALFKDADKALRAAKDGGRNRIHLFNDKSS